MAIPAELQRRLLACVRDFRAEQGQKLLSGSRFVELEDEACEIGDSVAAAMMEAVLLEQAAASTAEEASCPCCKRPGQRSREPEPRVVQTRRGEVAWNEPTYYCRYCRRAFFPSERSVGH